MANKNFAVTAVIAAIEAAVTQGVDEASVHPRRMIPMGEGFYIILSDTNNHEACVEVTGDGTAHLVMLEYLDDFLDAFEDVK